VWESFGQRQVEVPRGRFWRFFALKTRYVDLADWCERRGELGVVREGYVVAQHRLRVRAVAPRVVPHTQALAAITVGNLPARSLKLPSLPSQPVILTKPSHTSVKIFPPGSKVSDRPHSATARRNRIRSARIEGTPPHASYARIPRAPRRAADRSSDSELRSESEKSERKQGETSGDTRVRVNRDGAAPIGQR